MAKLKKYRHRCGRTYTCLHCEIARMIVGHAWVGKPMPLWRKKMVILRDLAKVTHDVVRYYRARR